MPHPMVHRKKEEKKSKKKSKHHEMTRLNVPPLLMNMKKESEPSTTDVFAGQILKNHGISLESLKEESTQVDKKPTIEELKRPILPIIDPATISSQVAPDSTVATNESQEVPNRASVFSVKTPRDEQIKEINEIEAKIRGLKKKIDEELDSMSNDEELDSMLDDEDFLNIKTEAEELKNDFAEDVFQIPPKVKPEPSIVKQALVLSMRRCVDAKKIAIQVPGSNTQIGNSDNISLGRVGSNDDNNIHHPTVGKDKNTGFIAIIDRYHPNDFLAKKLMTKGILSDVGDKINKTKDTLTVLKTQVKEQPKEKSKKPDKVEGRPLVKKHLSETSCESKSKQITIKTEEQKSTTKRKCTEMPKSLKEDTPAIKKRRASPIVFDIIKKEKEPERVKERIHSKDDVTVTIGSTHKYDSTSSLSQAKRKPVWCRLFPLCRYGAACAFQHPRCKFAAACTRRGCLYSHPHKAPLQPLHAAASPVVASHVVPARTITANYKSISPGVVSRACKYYPNCLNTACHYYHPKPCRYGKACSNKLKCKFYHSDIPTGKWRYPA
ncbi:uncharacterized protein LOC128200376 [Galleria mellonella]|uniref:Uncharacterized protein LOC128200376 n=1 Tax=Galleria mellonella TaxID=7137 RepID=A0ABM3MDV4_GALME|nr:uncharacterized protein LOC128200376 [Galleria mellonella]